MDDLVEITHTEKIAGLSLYDTARAALAACLKTDEVKKMRNYAEAQRAYARQAKDKQLETDAAEIRFRAERRLGELMAMQRDAGFMAKPGGDMKSDHRVGRKPDDPPTLDEAGIDKNLADRARKMAAVPEVEFEARIDEWRSKVEEEKERVTTDLLRSGGAHIKPISAPTWTKDQTERKKRAERGECVVANIRNGDDGQRLDEALLAWAEANDRFVRIDRRTAWGNPFEMPEDGVREDVVGKFAKFYFPHKEGLLSRTHTLRGKVLGCWCHPEECHGHVIAEVVNREASGEGPAERIADLLAEVDG